MIKVSPSSIKIWSKNIKFYFCQPDEADKFQPYNQEILSICFNSLCMIRFWVKQYRLEKLFNKVNSVELRITRVVLSINMKNNMYLFFSWNYNILNFCKIIKLIGLMNSKDILVENIYLKKQLKYMNLLRIYANLNKFLANIAILTSEWLF